ncbi:ABC transporter ATP-binding protein [Arthrobacter sp. Sa2CUA1]|uniref:ABC transporter ATP-binding protein n=1 Tax=Arthrobacter gallicola TaxID=2762225 RepID=A0ABR8UV10_9MICC|nr:ABC transporter ATP-binding protein [Arthrobacter gallicola]MBD7996212.1 ABC transporter ATP-binding protein [Arthrobacter gallicola]
MPTIRLKNVVKNYGGDTNAVENLDLTINDGDFMCLLGPSGCGKTTTVRMIAGLENITAGSIQIGDRMVDEPNAQTYVTPEQRDVGMVFQNYALWPHLSVADNVDYGLKLRKMSKTDRDARVGEITGKLSIAKYRDRYPSQLSGGQQQRVALARMLAVNPKLMLLDEPLSNLDSRLRLEMRAELKRIHAEFDATVVFVTHDQWEAMTLATHVAVMFEGVLQQVGSPMDIYDRPVNRFVASFLGVPPMNFVEMGEKSPQAASAAEFLAGRVEDIEGIGSIGIRPEALTVERPNPVRSSGQFVLAGRVESLMPTGGSWTVETAVGSQRVYATALQLGDLQPGDRIELVAPAASVHVFDLNDQRVRVRQ